VGDESKEFVNYMRQREARERKMICSLKLQKPNVKVHGEADEEATSWVRYTIFYRVSLVLPFPSL
jgi:hypothetical protein